MSALYPRQWRFISREMARQMAIGPLLYFATTPHFA
jgi:hypothetical protein